MRKDPFLHRWWHGGVRRTSSLGTPTAALLLGLGALVVPVAASAATGDVGAEGATDQTTKKAS
jgi:hypothetical protein